jgi:DNA-binding CsgD family transcriptional regulator
MKKKQKKALLELHSTTDIDSMWHAVQNLIRTVVPFDDGMLLLNFVGTSMSLYCLSAKLSKQIQPQLLAEGLKTAPPWRVIEANPGIRYVGSPECFKSKKAWLESEFHNKFMAPYCWNHPVAVIFWQGRHVMAGICLFRNSVSGEFTNKNRMAFDTIYDDIHVALKRILYLHKETTLKLNLATLLGQWTSPCILLDWDLNVVHAAVKPFDKHLPPAVMKKLIYHKSIINEELSGGEPLEKERLLLDKIADNKRTANIYLISSNHGRLVPPWWLVEFLDDSEIAAPDIDLYHTLSQRETEVVGCVAEGLGNQAIGRKLSITEGTVKRHLHSIHSKLGSRNKIELIAMLRK